MASFGSDGFLAVDSLVGKGTRVRIYLPRYDGDEVVIPQSPATCVGAGSRDSKPTTKRAKLGASTVLLVDDEEGVRRLAVRALSKAGWTVLEASSGDAALAMLAERERCTPVDAVISDMVMPGMDGMTLVRAVRAKYPFLPAILASGYAEEAIHGDLAAEGINFVPKPYKLKALIAALEKVASP